MKKLLILVVFFYFLALLETSFFIHFNIFRIIPNFILIGVVLINLLEKPEKKLGLASALIGGFFWSIFSEGLFGLPVLILLGLALFIKFIFKKHVGIPFIKEI